VIDSLRREAIISMTMMNNLIQTTSTTIITKVVMQEREMAMLNIQEIMITRVPVFPLVIVAVIHKSIKVLIIRRRTRQFKVIGIVNNIKDEESNFFKIGVSFLLQFLYKLMHL
jgi:hypothetical protein